MKRKPVHWWKIFNQYSRGDRNAILLLSGLILVTCLVGEISNILPYKEIPENSEIRRAFMRWNESESYEVSDKKQLFVFNPNTISEEQLKLLDIPFFVGKNMIAYRNAGGQFVRESDVRKIYGMNDSLFEVIEPFLKIELRTESAVDERTEKVQQGETERTFSGQSAKLGENYNKKIPEHVELNAADSADLVALRGIGPVFASRILRYRDLLGGYYSPVQLLEVYNFPKETYIEIEDYLSADTNMIRKIRINYAGYREFLRHPYLGREEVTSLIEYRDKHGAFQSVEHLYEERVLDSLVYAKVRPYLSSR